jgi:hypothetical protein
MRIGKQQSLLSSCMESVRIPKRLVHGVVVACLFLLWPCPTTVRMTGKTTESRSSSPRRRTSGIVVEAFVLPPTYPFRKKTSSQTGPVSSSNHEKTIRLHEHRPLALYPIGYHLHRQQEKQQQQQRTVQQPQPNKQQQLQQPPPLGLYPMGYNLQREQQERQQQTFQQQQQQQQQQAQGQGDMRRSPSSSRRNELEWLQQGKVRLVVRQYGVGPCFVVNLVGDSTDSTATTLEEPRYPMQPPAPPRQWPPPPPPLPLTYTRKPILQSPETFVLQDDIVIAGPGRTPTIQPEPEEDDDDDDETNVISSPFFGVATESNPAQSEYDNDDYVVEQVNGSYSGTISGIVGGAIHDQDESIAIEGNTEMELLNSELDSVVQVTDSHGGLSAMEDQDDDDEEEVELVDNNNYSMQDMEAHEPELELEQLQWEQQYSMDDNDDEEEVPNVTALDYDNPVDTAETEDMGEYDSEQAILVQTEELQQVQFNVVAGNPAVMADEEEFEETIARAPDLQSDFTLKCPPEDEIALEENQRLICVGDVHGDFPALQELLTIAQVYDRRKPSGQEWVGENTIVVQCGDVLDRGTEELACFSLLTNLSRQAAVAGGHVMILFGNHEVLNAAGLFHYTNGDAEYELVLGDALDDSFCSGDDDHQWRQDYGFHQPARWAAYEPGGYLSHPLMKNLKVAVKVGRTVCVHAGLTAQHVEDHGGLSAMNRDAQEWMAREVGSKQEPAVAESDINDADEEDDYETEEEETEGDSNDDDVPVPTDDMDVQYEGNDGEEIVEDDGESDELTTEDVKEWVDVAARQASTYKTIPSILGGKNADQSPLWMRDYSAPPNLPPKNAKFAQAMINDCLDLLECDRMVMGHTVQREINCALDGKAWRIDVGASRGVLGGTPEVLEIVKVNGTEVVSVLSMHYGKVPEEERQVFGIDLTTLF